MADPILPVGPQPIGPLRPEGTGGATGPKAPSDAFQKAFDQALSRLSQTGAAQAPAAAQGAGSALSTTQALLTQLQRMQQDLSNRLRETLAGASPEGALHLSSAADIAFDVHRDVRNRIVGLLKAQGMVASA